MLAGTFTFPVPWTSAIQVSCAEDEIEGAQ